MRINDKKAKTKRVNDKKSEWIKILFSWLLLTLFSLPLVSPIGILEREKGFPHTFYILPFFWFRSSDSPFFLNLAVFASSTWKSKSSHSYDSSSCTIMVSVIEDSLHSSIVVFVHRFRASVVGGSTHFMIQDPSLLSFPVCGVWNTFTISLIFGIFRDIRLDKKCTVIFP